MSFVYFTDRDLGKRFPEILKAGGLTVERHADHFAPDAADEVWLEAIGKRGWIALTHDRRIRYKPNERDAVMRHRVALLVIVGAAPFPDLARTFPASLPVIEHFLHRHQPPFIGKVYRPSPAETARRGAGTRRALVSIAASRQLAVPLSRFAGQDAIGRLLLELAVFEIDELAVLILVDLAADPDGVADAQRGELGFGGLGKGTLNVAVVLFQQQNAAAGNAINLGSFQHSDFIQ